MKGYECALDQFMNNVSPQFISLVTLSSDATLIKIIADILFMYTEARI